MKDWLTRCNQNKRTVLPHITPHLMCSLVLLLTIPLQLVAKLKHVLLPSLLFFTSLHSYALHLQSYRNHVKKVSGNYKDPAREGLTALKKIVIFWRFQNGSMMMMMMMMMMNCFCGMVDQRKTFSPISSRDHFQRSSPSRISDTPRAGFEPA